MHRIHQAKSIRLSAFRVDSSQSYHHFRQYLSSTSISFHFTVLTPLEFTGVSARSLISFHVTPLLSCAYGRDRPSGQSTGCGLLG